MNIPAVIAVLPSGPAISAPLAQGGSPAAGALHAPGSIPAQVSNSHSLQTLPHGASKVPSTFASDLHKLPGQGSGIGSNALHGTGQQLGDAIQAAVRRTGRTLPGQLPSLTSSETAQLIAILLSNVARNPAAIPSNLNGVAGSATANTAQQLTTVLTGVSGNLNKAASSLQALSSTLSSGTTATTAGDARTLLDSLMTDVASSLSTVLSSLNTLVAVLADMMSVSLSHARQFLQSLLTDVISSLGIITESLDTIADRLPAVLGNLPGDGPSAGGPDDQSASPPDLSGIVSTLAGSLAPLLVGSTGGASRPSSSDRSKAQIVDTIFGAAASEQ